MFVNVVILRKFNQNNQPYTYKVSSTQAQELTFSSIVKVPYGHQTVYGFVLDIKPTCPSGITYKSILGIVSKCSLNHYQQQLYHTLEKIVIANPFEIIYLFVNPQLIQSLMDIQLKTHTFYKTSSQWIKLTKTKQRELNVKDSDLPILSQEGYVRQFIDHSRLIHPLFSNEKLHPLFKHINRLLSHHNPICIITPNDATTQLLLTQINQINATNVAYLLENDNSDKIAAMYHFCQENHVQLFIGSKKLLYLPFTTKPEVIILNSSDRGYYKKDNPYLNTKQLLDQGSYQVDDVTLIKLIHNQSSNEYQFDFTQIPNDYDRIKQLIAKHLADGNIYLYYKYNEHSTYLCSECGYISETKTYCPHCQNRQLIKLNQPLDDLIQHLKKDFNVSSEINKIGVNGNIYLTDQIIIPGFKNFSLVLTWMLNDQLPINSFNHLLDVYDLFNLSQISNNIYNIKTSEVARHYSYLQITNAFNKLIDQSNRLIPAYCLYCFANSYEACEYQLKQIISFLNQHHYRVYYHPYIYRHKQRYYQQVYLLGECHKLLQIMLKRFQIQIKVIYY